MQTNSQQLCNATVTGIYQQFQDYLQSIAESTGTFREMCVEDLEEIWLQAKEIRDRLGADLDEAMEGKEEISWEELCMQQTRCRSKLQ